MKKTLLFSSILTVGLAQAQITFQDNFDTYTAGDYIGQQTGWTTWSGTTGGAEDCQVTNADAVSAPNSLYYSSVSATGGPVDNVLPFGGVYNTGVFTFSTMLKVEAGKNAYLNFQKEAAIGTTWALDMNFTATGELNFLNQTGTSFSGTYAQDVWFEFSVEIDLNTNTWEFFIDGISQGSIANSENQVASLNLYPIENSGFFVDDIEFEHVPYTVLANNGAVTNTTFNGLLATQSVTPTVTVRNLGSTAITSFDLTVDYDGNSFTDNITGVNIASLATYELDASQDIVLAAGQNDLTVTISNINGNGADDLPADDAKIFPIDPIVPAAGKVVVSEEGTGTWCGWCPRGSVGMDVMYNKYNGYWTGIAVHNGTSDPMTNETYDAGMGGLISGYPSAIVDRGADIDPSGMEPDFLERIQIAPTAVLTNGANWDASTNILNVSVSSEFMSAADNNYKIALVLVEDNVSGTENGYAQANYYSASSNNTDLFDPAGYNWKDLANPVPAASMVYNHVGRGIFPSFGGLATSFPATVNAAETHVVNFEVELASTWNTDEMHIVALLIDPSGRIDNAGVASFDDAITNGYVAGGADGGSFVSLTENQVDAAIKIFPNPTSEFATVAIDVNSPSNIEVTVTDLAGKVVSSRNFGNIGSPMSFTLNTSNYQSGVYFVNTEIDGIVTTMKLIVE